ncbi:MAG: hypothetical protein A2202_00820 [Bdellovibrionales bacterium RIFOXYA1_FULL_36_14]|nr:MAG: hypothetical protein A2202_00820 [Bdellovibrionales bacterium RIFOXYA1_FULL_36_14]
MTIRSKLVLILFGCIIIPTTIGIMAMFSRMENVVKDVRMIQLENIVDLQRARIDAFFLERRDDIKLFQANLVVQKNFPIFLKLLGQTNNLMLSNAKKELETQLEAVRSSYGYLDVMLVDSAGKIVLTANPKHTNNEIGTYLSDIEPDAFEGGKHQTYFSGIYKSGNGFGMLCTAPLFSHSNDFVGELVFEIDAGHIFDYVHTTTGLGNTGETFIGIPHGDEIIFISPLQPTRNQTIKLDSLIKGNIALPMQSVLQADKDGSGESVDYLGQEVIAAWRKIPSVGWGIVAKINSSEAIAPIAKVKKISVVLELFILVFYMVALFLFSKSIITPIHNLQKGMVIVGSGRLDYKVGITANDEIGQLSRAFDRMSENLQLVTASRDDLDKEVRDRKHAEAEVRKLNYELEKRVIERTAKLEESNKELEAFSYSVSHDLRAPLRHIQGFVEMLNKSSGNLLDDKGQRYLLIIGNVANKMGILIDDLLMFSRMGRATIKTTTLDLEKMIHTLIHEMHLDIVGRNIEWKIDSPLPLITCDPSMIRLVMTNLISNALKFTKQCEIARIEIGSTTGENGEPIFFVKDNGVGFDMQYVGKLFGVFQRLHRDEEFEGTGIGLANVRRIINRHGGKTWAEGVLNQGATIFFTLPNNKVKGEYNETT